MNDIIDLNENYVVESGFTDMFSGLELIDEPCALKHNDEEYHKAVDYLCQRFGKHNPDGSYTVNYELRIPVCEECIDSLYDPEWILFYCVKCQSSQWLNRTLAKKEYPKDTSIVFFDACPNCYKEDAKNE